MALSPQPDKQQGTFLFSEAWGAFARTRKAAQASAEAASGDPKDAEDRIPDADIPSEKDAARPATEEPPQDAAPGLAASVAASAVISAQLKPSFAQSCFNTLSYAAFLALPLLLLAQFTAGFSSLTPWLLPQEARFAESYELMLASGHWLMPSAAIPPLWFWVLRLLNTLPYVDGHLVYAAGAALAGVLTLLATWFLALSAGYGRHAAFAAGLVLLSCLAFPSLAHRVGPEPLYTGLLTLGLACLIRGWNKERSFLWLPLGCALAALAGLTNGIFGIALPVLGSLIFLAWKGAFARFNKMDGAVGFAILLALPLAWLGAAMLFSPGDARLPELCMRLIAPFLPPLWPPKDPVWLYAAVLPLALVPWMLVPLFVSWGSALAQPLRLLVSTRKENSGSAWIWIHLVAGLLLLSATSSKFCLNALPLLPLLAIVLGKAVVSLPQANSRAFFLVLSGLLGLAALALGLAGLAQFWPPLQGFVPLPYPDGFAAIKGLPILAGICLLTALVLWKLVDRRFPGACLLVCAVAATALCLPALRFTSPSMQDIFLDKAAGSQSVPEAPAPKEPVARIPAEEADSAPKADEKAAPAGEPQKEAETPAPPASPEPGASAPDP